MAASGARGEQKADQPPIQRRYRMGDLDRPPRKFKGFLERSEQFLFTVATLGFFFWAPVTRVTISSGDGKFQAGFNSKSDSAR